MPRAEHQSSISMILPSTDPSQDVADSMRALQLHNLPSSATCGLLNLPTELRLAIGEHVFQEQSAVITVDLRRKMSDRSRSHSAYSFLLTCRLIHKECASLRYEVNRVSIYAPIFTAEPPSVADRKYKEDIAGRFSKLAVHQSSVRQLRQTRIFLGQLPNLSVLRWIDFMASWLLVKDSIVSLKEHVHGLVFAFGVYLAGGVAGRVEMCADSPETLLAGLECCHYWDGTELELKDKETEKLRKIKTTITKTLYPEWNPRK